MGGRLGELQRVRSFPIYTRFKYGGFPPGKVLAVINKKETIMKDLYFNTKLRSEAYV